MTDRGPGRGRGENRKAWPWPRQGGRGLQEDPRKTSWAGRRRRPTNAGNKALAAVTGAVCDTQSSEEHRVGSPRVDPRDAIRATQV